MANKAKSVLKKPKAIPEAVTEALLQQSKGRLHRTRALTASPGLPVAIRKALEAETREAAREALRTYA